MPGSQLHGALALVADASTRVAAGDSPGQLQIERALEAGFGQLMHLQAQLSTGRRAAAGAQVPDLVELADAVEELRAALLLLRTLSSPPGPPRIGYGFVLPGDGAG